MSRTKDPKKEIRGLDKELKSYKGTLRDASFLFEDKVLELSLLRRVGDIVGYILDLESFYRMFLDILLEETNADNCSIMIMDTETNRLALKMARGRNDEGTFFNHPIDSEVTFSLGEGVAGKVALERKMILIDDVSIDKCFKTKETRFPIGSLLCTPLIFQEKVFGIINLSHTQTHAFNQNTKRIIELLCLFVSSIIGDAIDYIKIKDQEKFKSMFEGVRIPILLVEPKTKRIVGCNGYAEEWLGYSKKELIHTDHIFDIVPHEYREKVECIVNEIAEKNSPKFNEVSFIRKDGSVNIGEINGTIIDYQGKNIVQVTVKDVTERKRSEEQIKQLSFLKEDLLSSSSLDEKLKRITDGVVEIFDADFSRIWIIKPGDLCDSDCMHAEVKEGPHFCLHRDRCLHLMASSGRYTHLNGKVHRRVPFDCYKIGRVAAGKDVKFLINDVTHNPGIHDQEWARKLGLASFVGYRLLSKKDESIGVLALFSKHSISPEEDALLTDLVSTTAQVIQTTRIEEELKGTKDHLNNIIESTLDPIVTTNSKGYVTRVNKSFLKLLGCKEKEALGKHMAEFSPLKEGAYESTTGELVEINKEFFNSVATWMSKLIEEGRVFNIESYNIRSDNKVIPVEDNIVYLHNQEGERTGAVGIIRDITERKKAEKEIKESKEFLENIFKTSVDGIMVSTPQGIITMNNASVERMLGYSKNELIGKYTQELTPKESDFKERGIKLQEELFKKGFVNGFEYTWLKKDGNLIDVEVSLALLKDDTGNPTGVIAGIRDITERKKAEMALVRIRTAVDNASDGIAIADAEGKIFYQNQTFLDLFGYTAEEISKMEIPSFYENSEMISDVVEIMNKGKRWNGEVKILSKDGKTTSCLLGANPILDDKKKVIGYLGIHTDITNLKMAEDALIESKERYQDLIEFANVGIIVTDDGKITKVNRIAENIYGYSKDELIGKPASILTLEKYRKQHVKMLHEMVGLGEAKRAIFEEEGVKKDGTLFPVEISFSLLEPRVNTIIAVMRDTTERKEMEQKLLQSEKLKSLGELSGGVAHDFNNVLAAILGRAQLLKMIVDSPPSKKERRQSVLELKKGLEVIEKASLDGAETVRRIQEFARRRDDDKYFTLVDMTKVIDNALEFTKLRWKNDAESKGIKIKIKKKLALLPSLPGSESELREVIVNIINNAIDAMPQGGDITIKTFKKDNQACIKVTDTGIGIPQTIGNRIFDPFFTTKGPQSSGLGMSVSYGIIHRHRGTIMIDSVEGKGSTVTIEIPFSEKIVEERKLKSISSGQKKAKILIIEDEEDVCNLLKDILTYEGHEVETASNGKSGIEKFKKKVFDMVLTDLGMPGMSGWQVAEKIKSINGNVPIALITGWSIDLKESEIKERGIDFVIKKPYKLDQLVNIVQEGMILKERFK